jgi:hypothetical protein
MLEPDPFHISDQVMIKKYRWSAHGNGWVGRRLEPGFTIYFGKSK